jgi:hypothetical protein
MIYEAISKTRSKAIWPWTLERTLERTLGRTAERTGGVGQRVSWRWLSAVMRMGGWGCGKSVKNEMQIEHSAGTFIRAAQSPRPKELSLKSLSSSRPLIK